MVKRVSRHDYSVVCMHMYGTAQKQNTIEPEKSLDHQTQNSNSTSLPLRGGYKFIANQTPFFHYLIEINTNLFFPF